MNPRYLGLVLAFVVQYAVAQKAPAKFGDVSLADLKMTHYDKDTSAAAVVLMDYGESSLNYNQEKGFVLLFERLIRIKILTKEGLDWANFSIPLYHDGSNHETVSGLKAVTYNLENGKVSETKMKNDGIFKERVDEHFEQMKVTLPDVRAGSVVEITYKVLSDFIFNFQDWEFQRTIPTVWSEYRARIPEYFNYDKYSQGYITFDINEETHASNSITLTGKERTGDRVSQTTFYNEKINFRENRFRWAAKDVPAFKPEPFLTTYKDYISKINFELAYTKFPHAPVKNYMGTWDDINRIYAESESFGGEVTGNGFLKKIVQEITAGATSPEEKIAIIHNHVKMNMLWDGSSRKFIQTSLRKAWDEKKGNSAEINLLLAAMLDKAGFEVAPILSSTRENGYVREYIPASTQFNNVLCLVILDGKPLVLDATEKLLPIGVLPERCLNGKGLAVSKAGPRWVDLTANTKSRTMVSADVMLDTEGLLKGRISFDRSGYAGLAARRRYLVSGEPDYIKDLKNPSWEISKSEFQNVKELQELFKETHELAVSDHVTVAGDVIYINPFLYMQEAQNPFTLENRQYPVDFGYARDKIYVLKMTIPENYVVEELPATKVIALPGNASRYLYSVVQHGNTISVTSSFAINKSFFTQQEYPNLREFYNQVVAKQTEQIVLKKKQ